MLTANLGQDGDPHVLVLIKRSGSQCPIYRMARPSSSGVTLAGQPKERSGSMQIAILGIDLGKNSCSVVGLDVTGRVVLRRRLRRDGVIKLAAGMPGCVMAMEGKRCSEAAFLSGC